MTHFLTALLAICAATWPSPVPESITVRPEALIAGDVVTLGDIADITPPEAAQAAARIVILPAPPVGCTGRVARGYLRLRLRRAGLNPEAITISGADSTRLSRPEPPAPAITAPPAGHPPAASVAGPTAPPQALALPPVPRGTRLRLAVRIGTLTIETTAELLAAAVPGGLCRVRIPETMAVLDARLLDPSTAEVTR